MKRRTVLVMMALLLIVMGNERTAMTQPDIHKKVAWTELTFIAPKEKQEFERYRSIFQKNTSGAGWVHIGPRVLGNFIEELWCRGFGCDTNGLSSYGQGKTGVAWYRLSTLHYPKDWPKVFGVNASLGINPPGDGWGIRFYLSRWGKTVSGEGLDITFSRFEGGAITTTISIGQTYSYTIGTQTITHVVPGSPDEELARLKISNDQFRQRVDDQYEVLLKKVETALRKHTIKKEVEGPYLDDGVPPEKTYVPMCVLEEAAALEKAKKDIDAIMAVFNRESANFYGLLMRAL